jgi:hypothetical protein
MKRLESLTAVHMNVAIFRDVAPCVNRGFAGNLGRPSTCCTLLSCQLIFDLADEGATFLRNVGSHTDYTVLHP